MRKILALIVLAPSLAFAAPAVWTNPTGTTSIAVCAQAGVTCDAPTLATEGLKLDNMQGLVVTACAAAAQTLSGAGTLTAYIYDETIGVWSRIPDLDLSPATATVRCVSFAGIWVAAPRGRVAWVPSVVTASSNSVTVYMVGEKEVGVALATLADIKTFLSIAHLDDDDLLTRIVAAASTYFEQQVGRTILATDYVEIQDGNGGRTIVPSNYPVISIAASGVVINGTVVAVSTAYGVAGYFLSGNVIKLRDTWVSEGQGNVSISYRAGYATAPDDIRQAVLEMAALMYREKDRVGQQSRNTADGSTVFYYAPPARVVSTIEAYRRAL